MSDSAKTVHLPVMRTGFRLRSARAPKSSMAMPSRAAWWSRKLPVPAAQTVFMPKSATIPSSSSTSLLSCPPISMMVRAPGTARAVATAWLVISFFTTSPPTMAAAR